MPKPFIELSLDAFVEMLELVHWTRRIDAVHLHHTFRPNHTQFAARPPIDAIEGMFRFHTTPQPSGRGFSDIAQHATLDPRGVLWTGRNWNTAPASATGFNGNSVVGPFMIEMIGDFDSGKDPFDGEQRRVAIAAVAAIQKRFGLPPNAIRFHRQMSSKTCPGTSIDLDALVAELGQAHASAPRTTAARSPFAASASASFVLARTAALSMNGNGSGPAAARDAVLAAETELDEEQMTAEDAAEATRSSARAIAARGDLPLTPEEVELLRRHVVNLRFGALSDAGLFSTSRADVDRIFGELIPAFFDSQASLGRAHMDLAVYAHGGLIDERSGLDNVLRKARFWTDNGIYPLFFVWETGLGETVADLVRGLFTGERAIAPRDLRDEIREQLEQAADRVLEAIASEGGQRVWGFMKRSAEVAVAPGGGGLLVAEKIRDLWNERHDTLRLHAVGHSAGAIFHAHFIPALLDLKVQASTPAIQLTTLQLLAPAVTTELFKKKLKPRIGAKKGIASCVEYTMLEGHEKADTAGPYRKSLLYFVSRAFEPVRPTSVLGLEESVRDDAELMLLFGLAGSKKQADLVFSPTPDGTSTRHASRSVRHGDFDDDPATMNSVFRRILDVPDDESIVDFPDMRKAPSPFDPPVERATVSIPPTTIAPVLAPVVRTTVPGGRRRALCVGIDAYPAPWALAACVNDAETWAALFTRLGFQTTILRNQQASRSGLVSAIQQLISGAEPGDVLAFQFSGHGTQVRDIDGEESDSSDEALCPVDFADGALLVDDDLHALFTPIPVGVNLTCFVDCCHSGTITRVVRLGQPSNHNGTGRARFVPRSPALDRAHVEYRERTGMSRATTLPATGLRSAAAIRGVLFSACQDREVAFEVDGAGEFTRHATAILNGGADGLTHADFIGRVVNLFGPGRRQTPNLYPDDRTIAVQRLLASTAGSVTSAGGDVVDRLTAIERRLDRLGI
jgi:hypothetical protein